MEKNVYGIDLGTTNSVISQFRNGSFEPISIDGSNIVPSVVAHDGNHLLVGLRAKDYSKIDPENSVQSVKRKMGQEDFNATLNDTHFSAVEVSSTILKYLKSKAEESLQTNVSNVVITVPAYFKDNQRRATLLAGQMAGLNVLRIINEPTAAALAFSANKSLENQPTQDEKWLVYDLGGGTFDVSVVQSSGEVKDVLSSTGNNFLGGDDFDEKIVDWLIDQIRVQHGIFVGNNKVVRAKLRTSAEDAKIKLSTETVAHLNDIIEFENKTYTYAAELTRQHFESMIKDLVDSTIEKTKEAITEANCTKEEISRLLLVGGSTRIPLVRNQLHKEFSLTPESYVDPDLSVSLGATVQGALALGLYFDSVVVDVSPHTLGVAAVGELDLSKENFNPLAKFMKSTMSKKLDLDGTEDFRDLFDEDDSLESEFQYPLTFSPLIHRNTKLPARFINTYHTAAPNQSRIEVAIFQGESNCSKDNLFVGKFIVEIEPVPYLREIQIGMEYDINGIVNVTVGTNQNQPVKSYQLNLANLSQHQNFLNKNKPGTNNGVPLNMNILINKVESALTTRKDSETAKLLEKYKQLLNEGKDDEIDIIEDQLYNWLDA